MPALVYLSCLLLAAFSTLVSARPASSLTKAATVYNNCSGDYSHHIPNNVDSTPFYKPQIHVKPEDVAKNGSGWEEWLFISHNHLADGEELIYGYKWALGDPTSANYSHTTFIAWAYFPNGTFYRNIEHDVFKYKDNSDGGFTMSIANNSLTWDPVHGYWNASVNSGGYVINTYTENVVPSIPYGPNYQGENGQTSKGFFSRIDVPRGHTDGTMSFPWGLNYPVQSVGTLKHTWSYEVMADAISAFVRGSTFLPSIPPMPVGTLNWFQTWDNSGKEVDSMQFLLQADNAGPEDQVFKLQVTDDSEILGIVTTPKPVGLPLSFTSTEVTLPMCGPGADFKGGDKMTWKASNVVNLFDFVDFAGGHTLYQRVNVTGRVWSNGKAVDVAGGIGLVEVYHR